MPSPRAALVAVLALTATAPAASADSYTDTTPGATSFTVPAGVTSLNVSVTGGAGGDYSGSTTIPGGRGALVTGTVAVVGGQQLQLTVAGSGGDGNGSATTGAAGTPDGGAGGYFAGGGGGATRVLGCQGITCSVAVIAAGGGGAGVSGFVSLNPGFQTLPGGSGGAAGAAGGNGASDTLVGGGSGGQPGTAGAPGAGGAAGTGGAPGEAGSNGIDSAGGKGGNQTSASLHPGGGGGGGGVFGAGGGGSGASGQDAMLDQATAGGGGGGGGSSLAPPSGNVSLAAAGATPQIVLSWTAPEGSGPGTGPGPGPGPGGGGVTAPALGNLTLAPTAFRAAASGPSAAKRRTGTKVSYALDRAASVSFSVDRSRPGRRAKSGRCVKLTRANRKARRCTRHAALKGGFTRFGAAGANGFRFMGRVAGKRLKPGSYRLLATPSAAGKTGRTVRAAFRIVP
jgi:hypothetical protein